MNGAQSLAVESYLGWWRDAGLLDGVGDAPHDWFAKPAAFRRHDRPATEQCADQALVVPHVATIASLLSLPADLGAFDRWLGTATDLPGHDWSARCLPTGPANPPIMLLADVPDADDLATGTLFSGATGRLLDAMLAAIGRNRGDVRLASIALTRPVAGRLDGAEADQLVALARHHIALVRPRCLVLLGQQASQLIDAKSQPVVNQDGATVVSVAMHHPRLLLERPLLKRQAWEVLKHLKEPG